MDASCTFVELLIWIKADCSLSLSNKTVFVKYWILISGKLLLYMGNYEHKQRFKTIAVPLMCTKCNTPFGSLFLLLQEFIPWKLWMPE